MAGAVHQFFLHIWVPVQPGTQICPTPSQSYCTVEGDVTPSTDTEGSPASPDGETKGGQPLSSRSWPKVWGSAVPAFRRAEQPASRSSPGSPHGALQVPKAGSLGPVCTFILDPCQEFSQAGLATHPFQAGMAACLCPPSAARSRLTDLPGSTPRVWALSLLESPQGAHPVCRVLRLTPLHFLFFSTLCNMDTSLVPRAGHPLSLLAR